MDLSGLGFEKPQAGRAFAPFVTFQLAAENTKRLGRGTYPVPLGRIQKMNEQIAVFFGTQQCLEDTVDFCVNGMAHRE